MARPSANDLSLRSATSAAWARAALASPLDLLDDHAHLERKAAGNALALLSRAPGDFDAEARSAWARTLAAVARDETEHLQLVLRTLARRGGVPSRLHRNPYAAALFRLVRTGAGRAGLLDHVLVCSLIEARSCERFEALASACEADGAERLAGSEGRTELFSLYRGLAASERGHHHVFLDLAALVAGSAEARPRLAELLDDEARVLAEQAPGPRMHSGEPTRA